MNQRTQNFLPKVLWVIWGIIAAGLPIYYLMPDRDWNYQAWGPPAEIVKSRLSWENPVHPDEFVYSRIFIVRPSAENLLHFREDKWTHDDCSYSMDKLLRQYELPGPYRSGHWYGHGDMDFVECGNGLVLMRDYSRNKGGLMSARLAYTDTIRRHYPPHFIIFYTWGWLGAMSIFLAIMLLIAWMLHRCGARIFKLILTP